MKIRCVPDLFAGAEQPEVLRRLRHRGAVQPHHHPASAVTVDLKLEVDLGRHLVGVVRGIRDGQDDEGGGEGDGEGGEGGGVEGGPACTSAFAVGSPELRHRAPGCITKKVVAEIVPAAGNARLIVKRSMLRSVKVTQSPRIKAGRWRRGFRLVPAGEI